MKRETVLAKFLDIKIEDARKKIEDRDYLVLLENERYSKAKEYIEDSLWSFRPEFIVNFIEENNKSINSFKGESSYRTSILQKSIEKIQENLYEDSNFILRVLIGNQFNKFVEKAIETDGYGHFLGSYDGEEYEYKAGDKYYYIYRNN